MLIMEENIFYTLQEIGQILIALHLYPRQQNTNRFFLSLKYLNPNRLEEHANILLSKAGESCTFRT